MERGKQVRMYVIVCVVVSRPPEVDQRKLDTTCVSSVSSQWKTLFRWPRTVSIGEVVQELFLYTSLSNGL